MTEKIYILHPGGYLQCTSYLLTGRDGAVIIDPGSGFEEETLLHNLALIGVGTEDIRGILLTHCHVDHALGARPLQSRFGWPLWASSVTASCLRWQDQQIWAEHPERIPPVLVDYEIADEEVIQPAGFPIRCLATPGHTAGALSFAVEYAADQVVVFTGDLIGNEGHPGWAGGPEFSEENTLQSLERLLGLSPTEAYWGHGGPIEEPEEWLRSAIELGRNGQWRLTKKFQFKKVI